MTAIISQSLPAALVGKQIAPGLCQNDESIQDAAYRTTEPYTQARRDRDVDILWPRSSFPSQVTSAGNGFAGLDSMHQLWDWCFPPTGSHTRKNVTGTVVDSVGNAVSGATVKLFNTATGLLVDTQTSGSDGSFTCTDPNAVACFAVAYLAGSPDTEGTTVNTLTGT